MKHVLKMECIINDFFFKIIILWSTYSYCILYGGVYKWNEEIEWNSIWWPASDLERILMFNLFLCNEMDGRACANGLLSFFWVWTKKKFVESLKNKVRKFALESKVKAELNYSLHRRNQTSFHDNNGWTNCDKGWMNYTIKKRSSFMASHIKTKVSKKWDA